MMNGPDISDYFSHSVWTSESMEMLSFTIPRIPLDPNCMHLVTFGNIQLFKTVVLSYYIIRLLISPELAYFRRTRTRNTNWKQPLRGKTERGYPLLPNSPKFDLLSHVVSYLRWPWRAGDKRLRGNIQDRSIPQNRAVAQKNSAFYKRKL